MKYMCNNTFSRKITLNYAVGNLEQSKWTKVNAIPAVFKRNKVVTEMSAVDDLLVEQRNRIYIFDPPVSYCIAGF